MNRRSALALLGVVGVGGALGYTRFRAAGEGRVFWKQMAVDARGEPGSLVVLTVSRAADGSVTRTVHPDYRDAFDGGTRVPPELHRSLRREFGADEPYYVVRYEADDCNGLPGDEGGDAVEVSRTEFNRLQVGDCVRR
ncbi:hypothetical protein C2R22_19540 [Salinigranum rubrum]|uniref:Uncharacterized protein n=1 Tax=Salinigranum rubrum TaxID=755307 RepID=A0A2I8VNW0_9EURY|nr:hypothetical protein [Salinigranum rubrum]AUV83564.1 hypothetical protein C2R22_19540 [Salinigranum rubrum]